MVCMSAARSDAVDSTLVELARQFEQLQPEYLAALHVSKEDGERAHALAWQRVGRTDFEQPPTREQADIFFAGLRQAEVDTGWNLSDDKYEMLCNEIDALGHKIMDTPARTMAGLRAKATVAAHTKDRFLWDRPFDDLDWNEKGSRALIEAVCALTGLEVPAEKVEEDA
jgi:hypothetical protein